MKIICIGRNYVAHAQELQNEIPEEPVFFMKPDTALLRNNEPFYIPEWTNEVHHEVELVCASTALEKPLRSVLLTGISMKLVWELILLHAISKSAESKRPALGKSKSFRPGCCNQHQFLFQIDISRPRSHKIPARCKRNYRAKWQFKVDDFRFR
jgi:hypothetical protein